MGDDELLFLLEQSREKNLRLGITGMLLYKEQNFMQMLEGKEQDVLALYDTIRKDDRHKDVVTLKTGNIKERNFKNWSMGFRNMDKVGDFPKYDDYFKENLTLKSFQNNANAAYWLLVGFSETNQQPPRI